MGEISYAETMPTMWMAVKLLTRDGADVATVDVPRFKLLPEVLIWGYRFFQYAPYMRADQGMPTYSEVFAYYVPPKPVQVEGSSSSSEDATLSK